MSNFSDNILSITEEGTLLRVEVKSAITSTTKEIMLCKGGNSTPLLCIQGHETMNGFYVTDSLEDGDDNTGIIFCHRTKTKENSSYLEENYSVDIHEGGNIQLKKKTKKEKGDKEGGDTTLLDARIFMLPPLTFRSRTSIFNIDKIDTIAQSFQTDFYAELRLINIIEGNDQEAIEILFEHYGISLQLIDFMNVSEVIGDKEVWDQLMKGQPAGFYTYCIKLRMKAVINEQMEVHTFPFDIQPMTIALTFNACTSRVALQVNNYYPSIFFAKQFQSASVYDVVYEDIVLTEVQNSDPSESSAGYVYPRCFFYTYFARRPYFYMSNVVLPMTLLTLLGPLSNAIEADGSPMGTADRLSVSLTLLLTAVAYKFIVATSLPQVSYLTALDVQVLLCFGFLVLSAIENVVYPFLMARFNLDSRFEWYFVISYYVAFCLSHFLFFTKLGLWLIHRHNYFSQDHFTRKVMKETYRQLMTNGIIHGGNMTDYVLDRTLTKKGLKPCWPVSHPKHLYALGSVKNQPSTTSASKKVGVEQEMEGLVKAKETQELIDNYATQQASAGLTLMEDPHKMA